MTQKVLSNIKLGGFLIAIFGAALSNSLCSIGSVTYAAAFVLELVLFRETPRRRFPHPVLAGLLMASLLVSVVLSPYFSESFRGYFKYLGGFLYFYAAIDTMRTAANVRWVIVAFIAAYLVAALAGVNQALFGWDFIHHRAPILTEVDMPRLTGPFKHYNDFGSFLVPGLGIAAALIVESLRRKNVVATVGAAAFFVVLAFCLLNSVSRGAIVAAVASLFFFGLFFKGRLFVVAAIAASVALLFLIPSPVSKRFKEAATMQGSMKERILLIDISVNMIKEKPVFGLGVNTYAKNFKRFRPAGYEAVLYAHNSYLQIAAETGLAGIGLYLLFLIASFKDLTKAAIARTPSFYRTIGIGFLSGVLGLLVNALFESLLQSTQLRSLFWILMGAAAAMLLYLASEETHAVPRKAH